MRALVSVCLVLALPAIQADLPFPLEKALKTRRSIRRLSAAPLSKEQMGERAGRFCGTEAGLAAQNVLLEQVALGLAAGTEPWAVLPCGKPAE